MWYQDAAAGWLCAAAESWIQIEQECSNCNMCVLDSTWADFQLVCPFCFIVSVPMHAQPAGVIVRCQVPPKYHPTITPAMLRPLHGCRSSPAGYGVLPKIVPPYVGRRLGLSHWQWLHCGPVCVDCSEPSVHMCSCLFGRVLSLLQAESYMY